MASPRSSNNEDNKGNVFIGTSGHVPGDAPELYWITEFWANLDKREIYICGEIDADFGNQFLITFNYLLHKSHDPITIWLSTIGGDVEAAFMFYDLITNSPAPVTIIGTGGVASSGVLMLACGHKVLVTENCTMMNHESTFSGEVALRHSEAKDRRKWEDWIGERFITLIGRCTSKRKPEKNDAYWRKITNNKAEYWILGADAIVADGLADAILTTETFRGK